MRCDDNLTNSTFWYLCFAQATTDLNFGCTDKHSGTSAAAPLAAGMLALALQVR